MENSNQIQTQVTKTQVEMFHSEKRGALAPSQKVGLLSLQLRQQVKTVKTYPGQQLNNNFTNISFGQRPSKEGQSFESTTTRVCWVDVAGDTTQDQAKEYLDSVSESACIYRIISNQPILTLGQKYAVENGLTTMEKIAKNQVVRRKLDDKIVILKDENGKFQFKADFFSETFVEDKDLRGNEEYSNEELVAEFDLQNPIVAVPSTELRSIVQEDRVLV